MRAADPQRWSINLIRKALLLVAACFLTAIFIENLLAFRQYQLKSMAKDAFMEGAEYGFQKGLDNCVKPGGLLPNGETEDGIAEQTNTSNLRYSLSLSARGRAEVPSSDQG